MMYLVGTNTKTLTQVVGVEATDPVLAVVKAHKVFRGTVPGYNDLRARVRPIEVGERLPTLTA